MITFFTTDCYRPNCMEILVFLRANYVIRLLIDEDYNERCSKYTGTKLVVVSTCFKVYAKC